MASGGFIIGIGFLGDSVVDTNFYQIKHLRRRIHRHLCNIRQDYSTFWILQNINLLPVWQQKVHKALIIDLKVAEYYLESDSVPALSLLFLDCVKKFR